MFSNVILEDILFLDIETVPEKPNFKELNDNFKELWDKKSAYFRSEEQAPEDVYQRAGIYSEFGKIVCISIGQISYNLDKEKIFRVKSFYGENEKELLIDFKASIEKFCNNNYKNLCAHNGKEFDFPYIARRMLINGISLPNILNMAGKKPWEVKLLDTMELWKFGDYKHYTSLNLLCAVFNVPTPKDDIDGSQVASVFWEDNDCDRIAYYCEKDILATARVFLKYIGEDTIEDKNVIKF